MKLWAYLSFLLIGPYAWALPAHNMLIQKLEAIHTLDAKFNQSVFMNGRRISDSSGQFSLKKPGQLYWNIQKPHQQILIADGQYVWVYEPKLHQVTKKNQNKGVGGAAGLFVSGKPNLWISRYKVNSLTQGPYTVFQLLAKNQKNSLPKVKLFFGENRIERIEFWDQLGQYSQIRLNQVKVNQSVSNRLFHFSPPKNVDVINLG
jgi:outer membrane lipoprotein carrier protein